MIPQPNIPLWQSVFEHAGVAVSAITGVLAARGKRVDLFGVLVIALVTPFGGGTARDILIGDLPPVWLRSWEFLVNGVLTGVICFFAVSHKALSGKALQIADAFALAFFTIIGTQKGIAMNFHPVVTIFLGVVTGVTGGILRDVLLRELPMVFRPEIHLYATASLIGAGTLVLVRQAGVDEKLAAGIAVAVALVLRLAAIRWKISLPVLESRD